MPGAQIFIHHLRDVAFLVHEVVARHAGLGVAQPIARRFCRCHARVVQNDEMDRAVILPRAVIGRGMPMMLEPRARHMPRAPAMARNASLIAASLCVASSIISGGTPAAIWRS